MALTDIEAARVRKAVGALVERRRPPSHLREEVDLAFRISGHSVEIFEVREAWDGPSGEKIKHPVAKATYVRTLGRWRVFWQRRDLKWHGYEPAPEVATIDQFVTVVEEDPYGCFWG